MILISIQLFQSMLKSQQLILNCIGLITVMMKKLTLFELCTG